MIGWQDILLLVVGTWIVGGVLFASLLIVLEAWRRCSFNREIREPLRN